jgi:hypothetical protein
MDCERIPVQPNKGRIGFAFGRALHHFQHAVEKSPVERHTLTMWVLEPRLRHAVEKSPVEIHTLTVYTKTRTFFLKRL